MDFISVIPDAHAWVITGGVYKQVPLAVRGNRLFAKHGSGWIRLSAHYVTSHPKVRWLELDAGAAHYNVVANEVRYIPPSEDLKGIEGQRP